MHAVEDLENTLKDIFITTESTYNQQVELENLLEEVDPRSLIRIIWENSETIAWLFFVWNAQVITPS